MNQMLRQGRQLAGETMGDSSLQPWNCAVDGGVTLRGWRTEPSGKPVIHFLHGNGFCGLTYWPMLSLLTAEFDLFIHDILAHGDSDTGERHWGWNQNAEKAYEVWQQFRGDYADVPVYGVGHSMGGVHTMLWAARYPESFQRLLLLDPVIFTPAMIISMQVSAWLGFKRYHPLAEKTLERRSHWGSEQEALEFFDGRGMFKGWAPDSLRAYVQHALKTDPEGGLRLKCPPEREAQNFASFPRQLWPSIRRLRSQTHIAFGNATYPFVQKSVCRACRINPNITAEAKPGGHCFMQEHPESAATLIRRFLLSA